MGKSRIQTPRLFCGGSRAGCVLGLSQATRLPLQFRLCRRIHQLSTIDYQLPQPYGLGAGVGRGRTVGSDLGVAVEAGVDVGVGEALGVCVGVGPPDGDTRTK